MNPFDFVLGSYVFCAQHFTEPGSKFYEQFSAIRRYFTTQPAFSEARFFDLKEGEFANARGVYRALCKRHGVHDRFPALVAVDRDETYAPCSLLVCRVKNPEAGPDRYCWNRYGEENTVLVQSDWDRPGLARVFGWTGEDRDIPGATKFLDQCVADGKVVEDPGYFDSDEKEHLELNS